MPKVKKFKKIQDLEGSALDAALEDTGPGCTKTEGSKFTLFTLCLPVNSPNIARLSALLESEDFKSTLEADRRASTGTSGASGGSGSTEAQTPTSSDLENKLFASLSSFLVTVHKIPEVKEVPVPVPTSFLDQDFESAKNLFLSFSSTVADLLKFRSFLLARVYWIWMKNQGCEPIVPKGPYKEFFRRTSESLGGQDPKADDIKCGLVHIVLFNWLDELRQGNEPITLGLSSESVRICSALFLDLARAQEKGYLDSVKSRLSEQLKALKQRLDRGNQQQQQQQQ